MLYANYCMFQHMLCAALVYNGFNRINFAAIVKIQKQLFDIVITYSKGSIRAIAKDFDKRV